jgi:hypothetical protein
VDVTFCKSTFCKSKKKGGCHLLQVVSYDSAPEVMSLYSKRSQFVYDLQYNAGTVYKGSEVFFFSDKLKLPKQSSVAFIEKALANLSSSAA